MEALLIIILVCLTQGSAVTQWGNNTICGNQTCGFTIRDIRGGDECLFVEVIS